MTVKQLSEIANALVAEGSGDSDVAVNFATFNEDENGNILMVEEAFFDRAVQGADDSGPTGPTFPVLILSGTVLHAAAIPAKAPPEGWPTYGVPNSELSDSASEGARRSREP